MSSRPFTATAIVLEAGGRTELEALPESRWRSGNELNIPKKAKFLVSNGEMKINLIYTTNSSKVSEIGSARYLQKREGT